MFYTSNYGEPAGAQCNPPCTCGYNGTSCLQCPNDQQCHAKPRAKLNTFMRWSNGTDGPWSTPLLVPAPTAGDTNCACVIRKNSSLVCMGRPGLGMFRAAHWRDVESYSHWSIPGGTHIVGEDPVRTVSKYVAVFFSDTCWAACFAFQAFGIVVSLCGDKRCPLVGLFGSLFPIGCSHDHLFDLLSTLQMLWEDANGVLRCVTHGGGWGDPYGFAYWSTDGG